MSTTTRPDKRDGNPWHYASLGTQLAVTVLLGTGAGFLADRRFGTSPWGLIAGAGLGFALGLYTFLKEIL